MEGEAPAQAAADSQESGSRAFQAPTCRDVSGRGRGVARVPSTLTATLRAIERDQVGFLLLGVTGGKNLGKKLFFCFPTPPLQIKPSYFLY